MEKAAGGWRGGGKGEEKKEREREKNRERNSSVKTFQCQECFGFSSRDGLKSPFKLPSIITVHGCSHIAIHCPQAVLKLLLGHRTCGTCLDFGFARCHCALSLYGRCCARDWKERATTGSGGRGGGG